MSEQLDSRPSAKAILPIILDRFENTMVEEKRFSYKHVTDIGCGDLAWLREFQDLKAPGFTFVGVDCDMGFSQVIPAEEFNYMRYIMAPINNVNTYKVARKHQEILEDRGREPQVDLEFKGIVLCLEVAEHLPKETKLVEFLCSLGHTIIFSAAIPGQPGEGHINCQWQSYWAEQFAALGYSAYDFIRPRFHQYPDPSVFWWYAQNLIVYSKHCLGVPIRNLESLNYIDQERFADFRWKVRNE